MHTHTLPCYSPSCLCKYYRLLRQFLDANLCWFLSMRRTFRFASVGRRRASHFSLDYYPPLQFGTAAMHIG
jgi:hypothetical protein